MVRKNQIVQSLDNDMIDVECLHPAIQEPIIPPVVPIVSVKSVDGKTGDVVLENLKVGTKVYNGTHPVEILFNDLVEGGTAVTFLGGKDYEDLVKQEIQAGQMYLCKDRDEFWYGVGLGDIRKIPTYEFLAPYAKIRETASEVVVEFSEETHSHLLEVALKNALGEQISKDSVHLPIEKLITEIKYDHATTSLIFYFEDGDFKSVSLGELVASLMNEIKLEADRAKAAEKTITANLEQEIQTRISADNDLQAALETEANQRAADDQILVGAITTEIAERKAAGIELDTAIKANASAIEAEVQRAKSREAEISSDVLVETTRAKGIESGLQTSIDAHAARIAELESGSIPALEEALQAEATARKTKDASLDADIAGLKVVDSGLDARIADIEGKEASWDAKYDKPGTGIPKVDLANDVKASLDKADVSATQASLADEVARAINRENEIETGYKAADNIVRQEFKLADDTIKERVKALEDADFGGKIATEEARAKVAEQQNATNINNETLRATGVEGNITSALNAEVERAKEAERIANNNLIAEIADRKTADSSLDSKITAEKDARIIAISAEEEARKAQDEILANYLKAEKDAREAADVTEKAARESAILAEATERESQDTVLANRITSEKTAREQAISDEVTERTRQDAALDGKIATEKSERTTADITLQSNIEAEASRAAGIEANLNIAISNEVIRATDAEAAEKVRAEGVEATKADLPKECPAWLNPTGETPYPWFMASLDVESAGLGPDAAGNIRANVGAYNFNAKQYYKWEKNIPFAATQTKAGLMTAADKYKLDNAVTETGLADEITRAKAREDAIELGYQTADASLQAQINAIHIPEYAIRKEASSEFAAVYHLTKDGADVPVEINIPKDQMLKDVKTGTCVVENVPEGFHVGEHYIELTFDTAQGEKKTYIKVEDVVRPYTGDGTTIVINDQNVISIKSDVKDTIDQTKAGLAQELVDRRAEDAALNVVIGNEKSRAIAREEDLQGQIDALNTSVAEETARAISEEQRIEGRLNDEIARAIAAEATEKARAEGIEAGLRTDLTQEIADRKAAVQDEKDRAEAAEQVLTTNLATEVTRAKTAEEAEKARAEAAEQTLTNNLATEVTRATTAEATEKSRAEAAERVLTDNLATEVARAKAAENTKVDKEITSTLGKALIFNEADGGGAKFEHTDGTESFVGVNNGGESGIAAQIYADKYIDGSWQGAKIDVKNTGIYYTVGNQGAAARDIEANEIAVKGNVFAERDARIAAVTAETDRAKVAEVALSNGKIDIMPGDEYTAGNPYNLPYYFKTAVSADKITVTAETITLDGNKLHGTYSMDVPTASQTSAGLLSAADKTRLDATASKTQLDTAIAQEVTDRNTAIATAIDALDAEFNITAGQVITSITQTNGKITNVGTDTLTIAKVDQLQATLDALSARIKALEDLKLTFTDPV